MASPAGWLDIHGHFALPLSEKELGKQLQLFHTVDFLASEPWTWTPEGILPYLDGANVTMQMLSYIPKTLDVLRQANEYGAGIVSRYPTRFGLLLALPTGKQRSPYVAPETTQLVTRHSLTPYTPPP